MSKNVDEGHLQLVGVLDELARADPADAAATNTADQVIGLDTMGKEAERQAFMVLVRALEEDGYATVEGTNQAASIGAENITEKGYRRLRTSYGQLDSSAKRTSRSAARPPACTSVRYRRTRVKRMVKVMATTNEAMSGSRSRPPRR